MRSEGARVSHLARLAAVGLALALGALQQHVPSPKVCEVQMYLEKNNKQHDHHQRRRERRGLAARRVAARERGAARKGEEIKKFVRASAELVTWTEGISN